MKEEKRHTKGHFIEIGLAIGIPTGIPIGLILDNIALGPLIGLVLGLVGCVVIEKMYNKNPGELTNRDKAKRRKRAWAGLIIGLLFFCVTLLTYILIKSEYL